VVPRHFIFLLILPDEKVIPYRSNHWDIREPYCILHPDTGRYVYENPYKFYDRLIKSAARSFLNNLENECFYIDNEWKEKKRSEFEQVCELDIVTCTGKELILSRGADLFDPGKEQRFSLTWRRT
jgi:hypothetical protein